MRYLFLILLIPSTAFAFCPPHDPLGDTMCLDYLIPTENVDGSTLTDLAVVRVHYGFSPNTYSGTIDVTDLNLSTFTTTGAAITIPSPGPDGGDVIVYFTMTALDDDGNESGQATLQDRETGEIIPGNEVTRIKTFPDGVGPKQVIILVEVN